MAEREEESADHQQGHGHDHEHGHGHGEGYPPHEPAPPDKRELLPEPVTLVQGIALAGVAAAAFWGMVASVQKLGWFGAPLAAVLGLAGALASWAAAIHVTGGEKFDDHPWV